MNPKKFHVPITVACLFIAILAYNIWVPNAEWFEGRHYPGYGMSRMDYQLWGWFVGIFFGGMSYIGLYGLVCAFLEKDEVK